MILKRIVDFSFSLVGIIVLFPVFLIVGLAIIVDSPGPIFFRQKRIGKGGKPFFIYKFRTMYVDAEKKGGQLTIGNDPRVTPLGRILRNYKLDELPQLINVLKGEMSLVGPRPEVPRYVSLYDDSQRKVLELKPGITDIASIEYINESEMLANSNNPERVYIEKIMPEKIRLNLEYAETANIFSDLKIIISTLLKVLGK